MATWQEEQQRRKEEELARQEALRKASINESGGQMGQVGQVGEQGQQGQQGQVGQVGVGPTGEPLVPHPNLRLGPEQRVQKAMAKGVDPMTAIAASVMPRQLAKAVVASGVGGEDVSGVSGPTAPVNQANPLIHEKVFNEKVQATQPGVEGAAKAYRDLPADATPEQRQTAKQKYADALEVKAAAARQAGGTPEGRSRPMQEIGETGAQSAFEAFGKPAYVRPGEDAASIARYNQYLQEKKGISPYTIGGAAMRAGAPGTVPGAGGLDVLTPEEEQAAKATVEDAAKRIRDLAREERQMKFFGKYHFGADDWAKVNALREERKQLEVEGGFRNPMDRKAGLDPQAALARELGNRRLEKDQSSLTGLAERTRDAQAKRDVLEREGARGQTKEDRKELVARQTPAEPSAALAGLADYNARQQALAFEEERRRQQMIAAQLYGSNYAYNYR